MKKIGIIGGLGPDATIYYYNALIRLSQERQGSQRECADVEIFIHNLNHHECHDIIVEGKWSELAARLVDSAERLYRAGADFALIACNTAHIVFHDVKAKSPIPLLSIVEETCKEVQRRGLTRVGLFGSPDTMAKHYYQDVFDKQNISIIVPTEAEQTYIGSRVREELALGVILDEARQGFLDVAQRSKHL